ncbi:MAG: hypothetical protein HC911_01210 [Chloroflexaceae bacterium]|nr:hypothetical protein [Chloroflexaceae bacterium]
MSHGSADNPIYTLDGLPVSLLELSETTTQRLAVLGIKTVEHLARITLLQQPLVRVELTEVIQQELRTRLWLENIQCFTAYASGTGSLAQFIIESYLFHFVAYITLETHHCTCTYQWADARLVGNTPFHAPKLKRTSRRKKPLAVPSNLQQTLSLFDEVEPETQYHDDPPVENLSVEDDSQVIQSTMREWIDAPSDVDEMTTSALLASEPVQPQEDVVTHSAPVISILEYREETAPSEDQSVDDHDPPVDDTIIATTYADDDWSTDELPDTDEWPRTDETPNVAAQFAAETAEITSALIQSEEAGEQTTDMPITDTMSLVTTVPVLRGSDEDSLLPLNNENEEVEQVVFIPDVELIEGSLYLDTMNEPQKYGETDRRARAVAQWDAYSHWNHTLIKFVTAGKRHGDPVFLSIDDDSIRLLTEQPSSGGGSPLTDFYQAVRKRIVSAKNVRLTSLSGRNEFGEPKSVAFLAAMVIAASRMAAEEDEEQDVAANDYFSRLRDVLGIYGQGRPKGMENGAEELLWKDWSRWLERQGFQATAHSSSDGPKKFISYPLSQALLRGADKDRLRRLFTEKHWPHDWDADTLIFYVKREAPYLTKHLQKLLTSGTERLQAVTEAIYDVYEDWDGNEYSGRSRSGQVGNRHIRAGLMRSVNIFAGTVTYRIYPRIPAKWQTDKLTVRNSTEQHTLFVERPGWYIPFHQMDEHELGQGIKFRIEQSPVLENLILPARSFWVLTPDPDDPDSGSYASWGYPQLGSPFILLCRQEIRQQIEHLRDENLIYWSGEPRDIFGTGEWLEIDQCQVRSQAWGGVEIENQELYDMLRPRENISISLSGGLRAPDGNGWMEAYGPEITIFGFQSAVDVTISRQNESGRLWEQVQQTNQSFSFDWPGMGNYLIEATGTSELKSRIVRIVSWDSIHRASVPQPERIAINGWHICGALIEEKE